jgi:DNA-binding NtrC family response regulator
MSPVASPSLRLIAVDDDHAALDLVRAFVPESIAVETYPTGREFLQAVLSRAPDVVILDLGLPDIEGMELLARIRAAHPRAEIILLTAECSTDAAVAAVRAGASDYLTKPVQPQRFRAALDRSVQTICHYRELLAAESDSAARNGFHGMIGRTPAIRRVFDVVRRIGPHYRAALVTGPSGTGKELVARALHACSNRANRPLVVCNCAAIPESLLEAELFGRVRGAYTGAVGESPGYFGRAAGGTLVLDEIGDLPLTSQAALLRAVQFGEVQRLGAHAPVCLDFLIIACTNRDLRAAVSSGQFREDLFFRLGTFELALPTLAQRREDIPLLIRSFISRCSRDASKEIRGLTKAAEELLYGHGWPGNVRELEQAIHYGTVMASTDLIDVADLPPYLTAMQHRPLRPLPDEADVSDAAAVLAAANGDKKQAARILGISRATLYRRLKNGRAR